MDDNLQRLTRALRSQKCPPDVLAKVREQVAGERRGSSRGLGFPVLAGLAALLLFLALGAIEWSEGPRSDPPSAQEARLVARDKARVAEEARLSLACIGHILLQAGDYSRAVILNEAVPPLRNGIKTVQTTLKEPIGL